MEYNWKDTINGKFTGRDIKEEHFTQFSESEKKEIEDYLNGLSQQHKRMLHDRYVDQVNEHLRSIRKMMYTVSVINRKIGGNKNGDTKI